MTQEFLNMLYLFGCGALGKEVKNEYCQNLSLVRKLALRQESWDVIYGALREEIIAGKIQLPEDVFSILEKTFTANVAANIQRVEFNLLTVRKLMDKNIRCCILKGSSIARLYKMPETRISSDTDILIDEKDEKKVCAILKEQGYTFEQRPKNDHHLKAYHKIGGLLEVHVSLHSIPTSDIILDDEVHYTEPFMELSDGLYTLGVNDGLVYLSAHLIKHLINDGTGVRQMMDLLLYMKEYDKAIDWEKYNALMKKLSYYDFICVIKGIGVKFWEMDFDDAITEGEGMEALLEDCEIGGIFGYGEEERRSFYEAYNRRRSQKSGLGYTLYRIRSGEESVMRKIFPEAEVIKKRFAYIRKYPVLLPIGWVHRYIDVFLKAVGIIKEKPTQASTQKNDMLKRRMEMIEKLGMIKE